jgi:hypothetical protein
MACRTLEEAEKEIPSTLFPVYGLRRGADGALSLDAVRTVVDGLKSRGIDPKDEATKRELIRQIETLFLTVKSQYDYLVDDMFSYLDQGRPIPARRLEAALQKNQYLMDLLTVLRHVQAMDIYDGSSTFIEAWQNPVPPAAPGLTPTADTLKNERELLENKRIYELKMERVKVSEEKNRVATNYIGLYGFLNLIAIGLVIYSSSE